MSFLAAAAAQHNAADDQQESQNERNYIAEASERRWRIRRRWQYGVDCARSLPRQRLHDVAAGIDNRTDPGWSCAQHRESFLGCTQSCLGKVLRRTPAAKPCIVRRIEDEAGSVSFINDIAGEDDLVADVKTYFSPITSKVCRARPGPSREIKRARRKARKAELSQQ